MKYVLCIYCNLILNTNFPMTSDLMEMIKYDMNTYQHLQQFAFKFEYLKCHHHI